MSSSLHDVVIVGAGAAGLTAAVGLLRAGSSVAIVEAESLTDDPVIGDVFPCAPFVDLALPQERPLVQRGLFLTDGRDLLGVTCRDPDAFHDHSIVLRPAFDRALLGFAESLGAAVHLGTTALALIRDGRRVVGVATDRGPVFGRLTFLAEGDAAGLVAREEFEQTTDVRFAPRYRLVIAQHIDLGAPAVEERFGLGAEEGAAYDLLVRNPSVSGRDVPINAVVSVCTTRTGVSLRVSVSLDNLREAVPVEAASLMGWVRELPSLEPWLREGRAGPVRGWLRRDGGPRDVPRLIDVGLAVGGGATGLTSGWPWQDGNSVAARTGQLLADAVGRIAKEGGSFTYAELNRHYLQPLKESRSWKDMEFLRNWPTYLRRTRMAFGPGMDIILGTARIWTQPGGWPFSRFFRWLGLMGRMADVGRWHAFWSDLRLFRQAIRWREVAGIPSYAQLLLDGAINALRDFWERPRTNLPAAGEVRFEYRSVDGPAAGGSLVPGTCRRWFARFAPVLAAVVRLIAGDSDMSLADRLRASVRLLQRQGNILDILDVVALGITVGTNCLVQSGWRRLWGWFGNAQPSSPLALPVGTEEPERTLPPAHVLLRWPVTLPDRNTVFRDALWRVCPTRVFTARLDPLEQVQTTVRPERCVRCQACWRASRVVDWGFLVFARPTPLPAPPDWWESRWPTLPDRLAEVGPVSDPAVLGPLGILVSQLDRILHGFVEKLAERPASVDRNHAEYLELLARHAELITVRMVESLRGGEWQREPALAQVRPLLVKLTSALALILAGRTRRTWEQHYAWAAADGLLVRSYHLAGMRFLLGLLGAVAGVPPSGAGTPPEGGATSQAGARLFVGVPVSAGLPEPHPNAADHIHEEALAVAQRYVEFPDLFRDDAGRDTVAKLGGVKRLLARMAVRRAIFALSEQAVTDPRPPPEAIEEVRDRQALAAECAEIEQIERRLSELETEISEVNGEARALLTRQQGRLPAAWHLLLEAHRRLEDGGDAELARSLLHLFLDELQRDADTCQELARPDVAATFDLRPIVEPGSGSLPLSVDDFVAAPVSEQTGDFLTRPLDLQRPRLVPEMGVNLEPFLPENVRASLDCCRERFPTGWQADYLEEHAFVLAAVAADVLGRALHPALKPMLLETALAELVLVEIGHRLRGTVARLLGREPALVRWEGWPGVVSHPDIWVLYQLVEVTAPRPTVTAPQHLGWEALEVEALKADCRGLLKAAVDLLGAQLWRDTNLHASAALLVEAMAWLLAADAVLGRLAWLDRRDQVSRAVNPDPAILGGRRALVRCSGEGRRRLRRFEEELGHLRRGHYAPEIRVAMLLLDAPDAPGKA